MRRCLTLMVLCGGLWATALGAAAHELQQRAAEIVEPFLARTGIPSLAYTFFSLGDGLHSAAHGTLAAGRDRRATPASLYDVGSNAKLLTAVALLQLQDQGRVDLQRPAQDYLPFPVPALRQHPGRPVRVVDLLNHLSGLNGATPMHRVWTLQAPPSPQAQFGALVSTAPPGERYQYCNVCYMLAAQVVEQVSGQRYAEHVIQHLLLPAGVRRSGFLNPAGAMLADMALPHHLRHGVAYPADFHLSATPGAGGAWFTTEELARLLRHVFRSEGEPGAVSAAAFDALTRPYPAADGSGIPYGLGLALEQRGARRLLSHQGSMPGFTSQVVFDRVSGRGLVMSANVSANAEAEQQLQWLRDRLLALWVPEHPHAATPPLPGVRRPALSAAESQALPPAAGCYRSTAPSLRAALRRLGDEWFFENPAGVRFPVVRTGAHEFVLTTEDESLRLEFDRERPTALRIVSPEGQVVLSLSASPC